MPALQVLLVQPAPRALPGTTGTADTTIARGYFMIATINGAAYNDTICTATYSTNILNIIGTPSNTNKYPVLALSLFNATKVGTYAIALNSRSPAAAFDSIPNTPIVATYGTLTTNNYNDTIVAGIFNFTTEYSTKVANGSFRALRQ